MGMPRPEDAALTKGIKPTGSPCWVCNTTAARQWLNDYMDSLQAGGTRVPLRNVADLFREHLAMPFSSDAPVGNHLRRHTEGRWDRLLHG